MNLSRNQMNTIYIYIYISIGYCPGSGHKSDLGYMFFYIFSKMMFTMNEDAM